MKTLCVMLLGIALFALGGIAQADDPYVGSYSCDGGSAQGCEDCTDFSFDPPKRMVVSSAGGSYKFCDETDDCNTGDIQGGVARWTDTESGGGLTISGTETATFDNNALTLDVHGTLSGTCNCNFSAQVLCTK